jgi:hypothetical protein
MSDPIRKALQVVRLYLHDHLLWGAVTINADNSLGPTLGQMIDAALSAAPPPEPGKMETSEALKLVERLGHYREDHNGKLVLRNPEGPAAADTITHLPAVRSTAEEKT